jgi:hypothetical protein
VTILALPALDGRKPLAFLAALGVTRLLTVHDGDDVRVSWDPADGTAHLDTRHRSVDALVDRLVSIAHTVADGGVLPLAPADFPPPGAAPDRLRLTQHELRPYADSRLPQPDPELEAWLTSLVTDLAVDKAGRCAISLMTAPSGKQSMRTMLEKPLALVTRDTLEEALVAWKRHPGVTGEYLDHQVLFDAADSAAGESLERGVPGATWLALMCYPAMRTTAEGPRRVTTGWHRKNRTPDTLRYPLWSAALDLHAVVALLEHPIWRLCVDGRLPKEAAAFTVFSLCQARRRRLPGRTFDGVLAPVS